MFRIPTLSEIMTVARSRGADSEAPHLWRGLVAAWPLQEGGGTRVWDVSGYGNHGTMFNMQPASAWVRDPRGRALDFIYGYYHYISVEMPRPPLDSPLTIAALIDCEGAHPYHGGEIVNATDPPQTFQFRVEPTNTGGRLQFIVFAWAGQWRMATGTTPLVGTGLHMVAGTYDPRDRKPRVYVDGKYEGTAAALPGPAWQIVPNPGWPRIGGGGGDTGDAWFDGRILNVAIWWRTFTEVTLQELYADPWAMYRLRQKVYPAAAAPPPGVKIPWHLHLIAS